LIGGSIVGILVVVGVLAMFALLLRRTGNESTELSVSADGSELSVEAAFSIGTADAFSFEDDASAHSECANMSDFDDLMQALAFGQQSESLFEESPAN
jgi:hypothetical protein